MLKEMLQILLAVKRRAIDEGDRATLNSAAKRIKSVREQLAKEQA